MSLFERAQYKRKLGKYGKIFFKAHTFSELAAIWKWLFCKHPQMWFKNKDSRKIPVVFIISPLGISGFVSRFSLLLAAKCWILNKAFPPKLNEAFELCSYNAHSTAEKKGLISMKYYLSVQEEGFNFRRQDLTPYPESDMLLLIQP